MSQNSSSAVMAQRLEPHDSLDDFPTPSWGTRALMERVLPKFGMKTQTCWEPAANRGYMARPLGEYFGSVCGTDIFDYGFGFAYSDFLFPGAYPVGADFEAPEWIISNPPFKLAEQFIDRARAIASVGCAMLVRTGFLEGIDRYQNLFRVSPPSVIAQFSERIILTKGIVRDPNKAYWDDEEQKFKRPSTATAYLWLVWMNGVPPQPFEWIPPCRRVLERPDDYPVMA